MGGGASVSETQSARVSTESGGSIGRSSRCATVHHSTRSDECPQGRLKYPKRLRHLHHQHRHLSRDHGTCGIQVKKPKSKPDADSPGLPPLARAALRNPGVDVISGSKPRTACLPFLPALVEKDGSTIEATSLQEISTN